jgi:pimeloyl-ACP methyl ester carboxylesterase
MFDGFQLDRVEVGDVTLCVRYGGQGEPGGYRAMAGDVVTLMRHLGYDRFSVPGHDRGALVASRTAMDHPDAAARLAVMDGLPVIEHLERLNEAFVRTWWHWWFLGQTDKPAKPFINRSRPLVPDALAGRDGGRSRPWPTALAQSTSPTAGRCPAGGHAGRAASPDTRLSSGSGPKTADAGPVMPA